MRFRAPALASPPRAEVDYASGEWIAEEKYDGHRVVVSVGDPSDRANLFDVIGVSAWSRYGKPTDLPTHLRETLRALPEGVYDGELIVPGGRSYGVKELMNRANLRLVLFDVLNLLGRDVTMMTWNDRRIALYEIAVKCGLSIETFANSRVQVSGTSPVYVGWSLPLDRGDGLAVIARTVWARDGEGLILKRRDSPYAVGKRTRDWVKIKQLNAAEVTLVALKPGKLGPNSVWIVRDDDGNETSVKWKNLEMLRAVDANPARFVGRRCLIEYHERTPDRSYRHPRFDRWADE